MYENVKSSLIWNNLYDNLNFCFIKKKVKKILIELIINNFNINTDYTNMKMSHNYKIISDKKLCLFLCEFTITNIFNNFCQLNFIMYHYIYNI